MNLLIVIFYIFFFLFERSAEAYIDPGSAGIILQAIIGVVSAFFSALLIFWEKIKNFFLKKKNFRNREKNNKT